MAWLGSAQQRAKAGSAGLRIGLEVEAKTRCFLGQA